jgi:hypothetical protein
VAYLSGGSTYTLEEAPPVIPPPVEEAVAPPPEQSAAPVQQAAPPPAGQPVTYTLEDGPPPQQAAPPPAVTPGSTYVPPPSSTEPAQPAALPPETPRQGQELTRPGIYDAPVIGPVAEGIGNLFRGGDPPGYRPGSPEGLGPESYGRDIQAAEQQLAEAEGPVDTITGLKDLAGAHLTEHRGAVTPEMARNQAAYGEQLYQHAANPQQPAADANLGFGDYGEALGSHEALSDDAIAADRDNIIRAYEEGYTSGAGVQFAPGGMAVAEYVADAKTGPQRVARDIAMAPQEALASVVGAGLKVASGAVKAVPLAAKALKVAEVAVEAPYTGGLNVIVPGLAKGLGAGGKATGILAPSRAGLAQKAGDEIAEAGAPLLDEAQRAGTLTTPTQMLSTPARGVTRLTTPSADLAYDVDPTMGLRVYTDPANPAAGWRTPTEADLSAVQGALREMPQDARKVVRDPWFEWGMKHRDAAGDDFIDPLAPQIPARAGLPAISTGRNSAAHTRWQDDMVDAIERFDDPTGNRPVLGHLFKDIQDDLYSGGTHPLTRRTNAEHRLQSVRNVLAKLPAHDDHYAKRQVARLERMLPAAPGTIGTGFTARGAARPARGGVATLTRVAYSPVQTARMQKLASTRADDFWNKGQGPQKPDFQSRLVSKVPPTGAADRTAYENYQGLLAARLASPMLKRGDVGAIRDRFGTAVGAPLGTTAQRELDGLKEALDANGILPGAPAMSYPEINIALSQWLKDPLNAGFRVDAPPGGMALGKPATLGVYTPGSASEKLGVLLPDETEELLGRVYEVNGVQKTPIESLIAQHGLLTRTRELARAQMTRSLTTGEQRELMATITGITQQHKEYRGLTAQGMAEMSDAHLSRLGAASVGKEISGATAATLGIKLDDKNTLLAAYDGFNQMLRSLILYSPARGIAYPLMQLAGNLFTLGVANRQAIGHYNPLQIRTITKFLKDPERLAVPDVVRWREGMGLGRTSNVGGRVSRDQMGPYTFFSGPDRSALMRNIGKVLAPQTIKNYADAGDALHRLSLYKSAMGPAYTALKRQLPDLGDEIFREARVRTGMPLPISRAQMDTAIRQLEAASPDKTFTPVQLREALFNAAGGTGAPNKTELYNATDRVHRLYAEKLKELDTVAQKEVNRVAFDPLETNLDRVLQRTFLFSWWNTRAANLYAQEIAKSPIMLGMFSRAVADGQRGMAEGRSEGQQNYLEFFRSPAGFAMSLNPLTLSSSFLGLASMEQASEKAQLTGLGRLFEGGIVGNNLFLSPLLKAGLGWLGAFGRDYYQQDLTGMRRMENMVNRTLEVVNSELYTFHTSRGGNPALVPNITLNDFQGLMHEAMSGKIPGTMEVPPLDGQRVEQGQFASYVADEVLKRNPELGEPVIDPVTGKATTYEFEAAVREALANPDSDAYQAGLESYTQSLFAGPMTDKGGPMAVLGGALRENLPIMMTVQPSSRVDRWGRINRDEMRENQVTGMLPGTEKTAVDAAMGHLPYETEEMRAYELVKNDYWGNSNPQAKAARGTAKTITDGTLTEPITVLPGVTFTPEEVAAMSEKDRWRLRDAWLDSAGYGDDEGVYQENQAKVLAEHPELAAAFGWEDWIEEYPGGPLAALDATAAVNPNVAQWARDPKNVQARQNSPEEFAANLKYLGPLVAGIKAARFSFPVDKAYAGKVGGLEGSVGTWYLEENAGGEYVSEWQTAAEEGLPEYTETVNALNTFDPSGATAAEYTANVAAGSSRPIPYGAYSAGVRGYVPDGPQFGEYLTWAQGQPQGMDTSPATWQQESGRAYDRERTIEIRNELDAGVYVAEAPDVAATEGDTAPSLGIPDAGRPEYFQTVEMAEPGPVYDAPGGRPLGQLQPAIALTVIETTTGADGKKWAVVADANGQQFAIPASQLRRAA